MNSYAAYDIPFTLVSDIFTPTPNYGVSLVSCMHLYQVLKDQSRTVHMYSNKKTGWTGHCSGCNHFPSPLPPQKKYKKNNLNIWIPKMHGIQTPNPGRSLDV